MEERSAIRRTGRLLLAVAVTVWWAGAGTMAGRQGGVLASSGLPGAIRSSLLPTSAYLSDIACPSATVCYAAGASRGMPAVGVILETADGGRHWTAKTIAAVADVERISCPRITLCFALGSAPLSARGTLTSVLLATSDGGTSWRTVRTPPLPRVVLLDLACPGPRICDAVGPVFNRSGGFPSGIVLRTLDGGISWHAWRLDSYALASVVCRRPTTCFAVGGTGTLSGVHAVFLTTGDGGRTWVPRNVGSLDGLYRIACPSDTTCYDVGGGRTAAGAVRGVIMTTRNEGRTWTRGYRTGPGDAFLDGVSCPTVRFCLAVGDEGRVVITRDGGMTWTDTAVQAGQDEAAVACPVMHVCYVAGWEAGRSRSTVLRIGN